MNRHQVFHPIRLLVLIPLLVLLSCPSPVEPPAGTGDIEGHARYIGQTQHSGILISAESTDGGKSLTVSRLLAGFQGEPKAIAALDMTDSDGAYELQGLAAGTYTVCAISADSLEKAVTTGVTVEAGKAVTAADLNLTATGQISGQATLNGAASGNLGIVVYIAGTSYAAMTDDAGNYTIDGVPAGTGWVLVASTSNPAYDSVVTNVDVLAGDSTAVDPLVLPAHVTPVSTGTITGTAWLNGASEGNAGIAVYLAGSSYITMTDDAGTFNLGGVVPGSYTLEASKEGYTPVTVNPVTVTAGSTTGVGTLGLSSGPEGIVTTLAGFVVHTGSDDGMRSAARFYGPIGIATDGLNLYVADTNNHTIRKVVISTGVVSTLAGTAYSEGSDDGTGSSALFFYPRGIATDGTCLYVADSYNQTIRRIVISTGVVTTLAGAALIPGSADGTGSDARFRQPYGIATDGTDLFVADTINQTIRRIVISTGVVTTLAGEALSSGSADGTGSAARFDRPCAITTDGTSLFVADYYNHTIRKIVISTGVVTTLAGAAGVPGSTDGTGSAARLSLPTGIATDGTSLYVADCGNFTIRKIVISTGVVTTLAGAAGIPGWADGTRSAARFTNPRGITANGASLFVTDANAIRMIR